MPDFLSGNLSNVVDAAVLGLAGAHKVNIGHQERGIHLPMFELLLKLRAKIYA